MEYIRNISLDVNATQSMTTVKAKQGDYGTRFVNITLTKDQQKITITDETVSFRCEKPDGKAVVNDATVNTDGTVTIEITDQVTAVPGRCKSDISIVKDGAISTALFVIEVIEAPDVADRSASSDQFHALEKAISDANEAIEKIPEEIGKVLGSVYSLALSSSWSGNDPYTQPVTITGYEVTENTKVDLCCTQEVLRQLEESGTESIYIINNSGTLTAYATGAAPSGDIAVQAVILEIKHV